MRRLLLLLALFLSSGISTAHADLTPDQLAAAKEHYETAQRHYNVGEFDKAIDEYKAAYEISGAAGLLFNIAQAYRLAKNVDQALFFYNSYLRASPNASNRADVEKMIAQLNAIQQEHPPNPPLPETRPTTQPVTPPTPPITPITQPVQPPTGPSYVMRQHDATLARIGKWTLAGGAVGLAGGMLFGIAAAADAKTISDRAAMRSFTWDADNRKIYDRGKAENGVAVALYSLGAIAAVAGTTMWLLGGKQERVQISAAPTSGGAMMGVSCVF